MNLPFTGITQSGIGVWTYTWSSVVTAYYRVILNGQLLGTVTTTSFTITGGITPPPIEVVIATDLAESEINSPVIHLQWYGDTNNSSYEVQEYISGTWTLIASYNEIGKPVYTHTIINLDDESTHQYKVIAHNSIGGLSTGTEVDFFIVRPPPFDESSYSVTYNGTAIAVAGV